MRHATQRNTPRRGDRITVTIDTKPTLVYVEKWCAASAYAASVAVRQGLKYSAYAGGYVVFSLAPLANRPRAASSSAAIPGDHPAMRDAMA